MTLEWTCPRCCRAAPRVTCSAVCTACRAAIEAAGLRFCPGCLRAVPESDYLPHRCRCKDCRRIEARAEKRKTTRSTPPRGYVRLVDVAKRLGYDRRYLCQRLKQGWMRGHRWHRRPRSAWYLEDMRTYPLWEGAR